MDKKNQKHKVAMKKLKANDDESIGKAKIEKGLCLLLTGDGKGKTTSAMGMVVRALGYGQRVGVVQFIKGEQQSGEDQFFRSQTDTSVLKPVVYHQMNTGFTWDTQDRTKDILAAEATWKIAEELLGNSDIDLVVLDELTYMLSFKYLDEQLIIDAITHRPAEQNVVITGRGGGAKLKEIADTVSEVKEIKHAYKSGIKARQGIDY